MNSLDPTHIIICHPIYPHILTRTKHISIVRKKNNNIISPHDTNIPLRNKEDIITKKFNECYY